MTDKSLATIISLTNEISILKMQIKELNKIAFATIRRSKKKLKQLEEPAYEWEYQRKGAETEV